MTAMERMPVIIPVRDASVGFGLLPRWLFPWVQGPLWRLAEAYDFDLAGREAGILGAAFELSAGRAVFAAGLGA
jgi:hypothetical protein